MPPTGTQALRARRVHSDGSPEAQDVNQLIDVVNGNFGMPIFLTGLNRSDFYALLVKNLDPTNSLGLQVLDDTNFALLTVAKANTVIKPELFVRETFWVTNFAGTFVSILSNPTNTIIKPILKVRDTFEVTNAAGSTVHFSATSSGATVNSNTVWHAGNDGAGSGMDSDTVDGSHASAFATSGHTHTANARIANGDYTGNGGTTARQITTGFKAEFVHIIDKTSDDTVYITTTTEGATRLDHGAGADWQTPVHLHASDGFVVADGAVNGNESGDVYHYVAFG
jgi:hypothetical protein